MKPARVLIVEDEAIVAMDIADRLSGMGYELAGQTANGELALTLAKEQKPDLVLMDIRLQGDMDGVTAAEAIRHQFRVPVIFLTAYSEETTLHRAKRTEPFGYILKPFDDRELRSTIEIALYKHRSEEEIRRLNRLYDVLSQVNQTVVRVRSREELLPAVCRLMVERGEIDLAWIGWLDGSKTQIQPIACFGNRSEILKDSALNILGEPEGHGNPGRAIREGHAIICNECTGSVCLLPSLKSPSQHGFHSCGSFPLRFQGEVCGVMVLYAARTGFFREREIGLLREVAMDISFALDKIDGDHRRKRQEEELRLFKAIIEASNEAIAIRDADGRMLYTNLAHERLFGRSWEEAGAITPETLYAPDSIDLFKQEMLPALSQGKTWEGEIEVIDGQGRQFPLWQRIDSVRDPDGRLLYSFGLMHDITEKKQAEVERLTMERHIQQAQKLESLGVLAGGIAHDFNNILMGILGYASLALDDISPMSPVRNRISEIIKASRRAAELCRQMLAYSGRGKFVVERIDLCELIEEMVHLLKTSVSKKAVLNLKLEKGLPPLEGDATQVRQIVMNLIMNASEAIGDRSGVITVSTGAMYCAADYLSKTYFEWDLAAGLCVYLEVSDTGCGMDKETAERIFEPFFTTKFIGRGLGLSATMGIVRGHHGALKVYTEVGKGTTFKILFPAVKDDSTASACKEASSESQWQGRGGVLLVDDEETVRALGRTMLERLGFEVLTARDGREALDVYEQSKDRIDLVLLDLTMPHMDGEETFRELRRIAPAMPVIMSSGYTEHEISARFAGKGLAGFIQKPYTMQELRKRLLCIQGLSPGRKQEGETP
ncbi:MAG: response regulator [Syntrophobacteraceae bacterium]